MPRKKAKKSDILFVKKNAAPPSIGQKLDYSQCEAIKKAEELYQDAAEMFQAAGSLLNARRKALFAVTREQFPGLERLNFSMDHRKREILVLHKRQPWETDSE